MKPIHSCILIPFISFACFSQEIHPFEKYQFDSTYLIVGLPDFRDNNYKKYSFLLDKPADMEALKKAVVLEQKTDPIFKFDALTIYIVKSKEIVDQFLTSPANNKMPINGEFYQFNFSLIRQLSRQHPLDF